jgi:hypothetical protein
MLNFILAILLSAFQTDNLKKYDNEDKDDRIKNEIKRFKGWFMRLFSCFYCSCCEKLPCFRKANKVSPNDTELDNVQHRIVRDDKSEENKSDLFLNKDKLKEIKDERHRKKMLAQKETMKLNQEKNTTKTPKGILHRCFPLVIYKK